MLRSRGITAIHAVPHSRRRAPSAGQRTPSHHVQPGQQAVVAGSPGLRPASGLDRIHGDRRDVLPMVSFFSRDVLANPKTRFAVMYAWGGQKRQGGHMTRRKWILSAITRTVTVATILAGAGVATAQRAPGGPRGPSEFDAHYSLSPDSLPREGVPRGEVRGPFKLPSTVYPGVEHTYWVYVPAQYDGSRDVSLMVFNDGATY